MIDARKKFKKKGGATVFLMGMPGAGKSTQAQILEKELGFEHIETSELIKEKLSKDNLSPRLKERKKEYDNGELIDPNFAIEVLLEKIKEVDYNSNLAFSGSPRTLAEAEAIIPKLVNSWDFLKAFLLDVEEGVAKKRILNRVVCSDCEKIILPTNIKDSKNKCSSCGAELVERKIDNESIFDDRMEEYRKRTIPAIEYIKASSVDLIRVEGNSDKTPKQVFENIYEHLKEGN